nr:hypothetical protein [Tanacetum cinerariifolium]
MGQDRQIQMVGGNRNQNQIGNGNLVAARAKGNAAGQNGTQIRCYNCRGVGHYARNCTVRPMRRDAAYLQTQLLIAQKEEAGIQLQAEEYDLMAAAADLDEIEKYTKLLEPIPESHQVPQLDNDVISEDTSVEQGGETVEQHPANFEETCALYESLYHNLAIEVEKVNSINCKLKETNTDLTTELARYKNQERCFEISQEKYDKLERCYQQSVYQEQCLSKKINALYLSSGKQIMTLNEQISELNKQLSKEKSTVSFLLEEKKKLKSDFKTCEDELLDKQIQLDKKIKELNNILLKTGQSIHMLSPKPNSFYHTKRKMALGYQNPFYLKQAQKKQQSLYDGKMLLEKHDPPVVHDSEETLQLAQKSHDKMKQMNKKIKPANYTKINHLSGVVSQDIMIIVQNESVVDTSDLQTELGRTKERFKNCIIKKETEYAKLWNDWSAGKSTTGSKSRQASASESAFVEEHVQTTSQIEEPSHPVFETAAPGSTQTWKSELAKQADSRSSFNELLDTPLDFSNFIMNWLRVDTLTPELLAGPTYELMKGSCNSLTELEYHLEEVYKATTDQLNWVNPEGQHQKYTTSVTKKKAEDYGHIKWIEDLVPRTMWIQDPINYNKHALWGVSHWGRKRQQFYRFVVNQESALDVYSKRRIIAVTGLKIVEWHNYKHLDWISDVYNEYRHPATCERSSTGSQNQKRLNLTKPDTYRSDLKRREAYTAYSNPRGFIYQNKDKKNRLMRIDELHKFSDGTLNDVRNAVDDRLKRIRMQYLPQTIWRKCDKDRAAAMIQAIDKMLKTRRIMRSLERFVGGRLYEGDFWMLQRTI